MASGRTSTGENDRPLDRGNSHASLDSDEVLIEIIKAKKSLREARAHTEAHRRRLSLSSSSCAYSSKSSGSNRHTSRHSGTPKRSRSRTPMKRRKKQRSREKKVYEEGHERGGRNHCAFAVPHMDHLLSQVLDELGHVLPELSAGKVRAEQKQLKKEEEEDKKALEAQYGNQEQKKARLTDGSGEVEEDEGGVIHVPMMNAILACENECTREEIERELDLWTRKWKLQKQEEQKKRDSAVALEHKAWKREMEAKQEKALRWQEEEEQEWKAEIIARRRRRQEERNALAKEDGSVNRITCEGIALSKSSSLLLPLLSSSPGASSKLVHWQKSLVQWMDHHIGEMARLTQECFSEWKTTRRDEKELGEKKRKRRKGSGSQSCSSRSGSRRGTSPPSRHSSHAHPLYSSHRNSKGGGGARRGSRILEQKRSQPQRRSHSHSRHRHGDSKERHRSPLSASTGEGVVLKNGFFVDASRLTPRSPSALLHHQHGNTRKSSDGGKKRKQRHHSHHSHRHSVENEQGREDAKELEETEIRLLIAEHMNLHAARMKEIYFQVAELFHSLTQRQQQRRLEAAEEIEKEVKANKKKKKKAAAAKKKAEQRQKAAVAQKMQEQQDEWRRRKNAEEEIKELQQKIRHLSQQQERRKKMAWKEAAEMTVETTHQIRLLQEGIQREKVQIHKLEQQEYLLQQRFERRLHDAVQEWETEEAVEERKIQQQRRTITSQRAEIEAWKDEMKRRSVEDTCREEDKIYLLDQIEAARARMYAREAAVQAEEESIRQKAMEVHRQRAILVQYLLDAVASLQVLVKDVDVVRASSERIRKSTQAEKEALENVLQTVAKTLREIDLQGSRASKRMIESVKGTHACLKGAAAMEGQYLARALASEEAAYQRLVAASS